MNKKSMTLFVLIFSARASLAHGQATFTVQNDTGRSMDLLVLRQATNSWTTIEVPRNENVPVRPVTEGNCYLVARDRNTGRDYHIGWYDLRGIAANNHNPVLQLSISTATEMKVVQDRGRQRTVTVKVPFFKSKWIGVRKQDLLESEDEAERPPD